MKKVLKNNAGILLLIAIETYFFFKSTDYEMFFLLWSVILFIFLIYNIFNYNGDNVLTGLGASDLGGALAEKMYESDASQSRSGGLLDILNFKYLIVLMINVLGYIVVYQELI